MSRNTTTDDLDRRGMTAFSLFAALCLAGILTLFSQTSHRTEAQLHGERTSLNPTTDPFVPSLPNTTDPRLYGIAGSVTLENLVCS